MSEESLATSAMEKYINGYQQVISLGQQIDAWNESNNLG